MTTAKDSKGNMDNDLFQFQFAKYIGFGLG
jgi:hypothetical protein